MSDKAPKVSVILPCFESRSELEKTLNSIAALKWPNVECLVVDGGSRDGTREFLDGNAARLQITWWVSEPDTGISDAFNKGIAHATGDYLYFIGAGDTLKSPTVFDELLEGVDSEKDTLICGQVSRTSPNKQWVAPTPFKKNFDKRLLKYRMALPHQALLTHRRFFQEWGGFDTDLKYAMDYELLLRAWHQFPDVVMKPVIVAEWVEGGVGAEHTLDVYREYQLIKARHHVAPAWWLNGLYVWHCMRYRAKSLLKA
jgi:glycosyltransferase involved in cell wall biosynthesis